MLEGESEDKSCLWIVTNSAEHLFKQRQTSRRANFCDLRKETHVYNWLTCSVSLFISPMHFHTRSFFLENGIAHSLRGPKWRPDLFEAQSAFCPIDGEGKAVQFKATNHATPSNFTATLCVCVCVWVCVVCVYVFVCVCVCVCGYVDLHCNLTTPSQHSASTISPPCNKVHSGYVQQCDLNVFTAVTLNLWNYPHAIHTR